MSMSMSATGAMGTKAVVLVMLSFSVFQLCFGADPIVETTSGRLQGKEASFYLEDNTVRSYQYFRGVPYAAPPVGNLRFRPPEDVIPWSNVRKAIDYGPRCAQNTSGIDPYLKIPNASIEFFRLVGHGWKNSSEDCLYLNIYTPSICATRLPVLVWIHGGSWTTGSGNGFPGETLAVYQDVVVVTINYRLGLLGFLGTGDAAAQGNYALLDQIAALKWVQDNIAQFGGNPDEVTIAGASVGGISVSLHVLSPLSDGLFHRAISQSGVNGYAIKPCVAPAAMKAKIQAKASAVGCETGGSTAELMSCLREVPVDALLAVTTNDATQCVVDGQFLPEHPDQLLSKGRFRTVPYLMGNNVDDTFQGLLGLFGSDIFTKLDIATMETIWAFFCRALFPQVSDVSPLVNRTLSVYLGPDGKEDPTTLRNLLIGLTTDLIYTAPTVSMANYMSGAAGSVFVYELQRRASFNPLGNPSFVRADHMDDLVFVFGLPLLRREGSSDWRFESTRDDRDLSLTIMSYWANFARTGDPHDSTGAPEPGMNLPQWPAYRAGDPVYMMLDVTSLAAAGPRTDKMEFWNDVFPKMLSGEVVSGGCRTAVVGMTTAIGLVILVPFSIP